MYSLNIKGTILYLRDLGVNDLEHVLKWFNDIDDFKYATGIFVPVTIKEVKSYFFKNFFSQKDFCLGIFSIESGKMIGFLKGQITNGFEDTAWINTIMIEPGLQRKGYGTEVVNMLIGYLKENTKVTKIYLSVCEENIIGKLFWKKQNFSEIMRINKSFASNYEQQGISIMCRQI